MAYKKREILNKQIQSVFTKKRSTTATHRLLGKNYPPIGNVSIPL